MIVWCKTGQHVFDNFDRSTSCPHHHWFWSMLIKLRLVDGGQTIELWHPESPGGRVSIRPCFLRRIGIIRSDFATLGETIAMYKRDPAVQEILKRGKK